MRIGVSGVRGIVGKELGPTQVISLCDSFAAMSKSRQCVIGTDTRDSKDMLCRAAIASLEQNGIDVHDLGVASTPEIFRESRKTGAAIAITASHNPPEWNGLKFAINGRGVDAGTLPSAMNIGMRHGNVGKRIDVTSTYVDDAIALVGNIQPGTSVAIDAGGGAALHAAKPLLEKINCKVDILDTKRDSDPTNSDLSMLADASRQCDIGLGFDLDGDRVVIAKDGKIHTPDTTVAIGVQWALERGCKKFALSQDTSSVIEKMIVNSGASTVKSAVGETNVINAIDRQACDAGGEGSSAGFIFPEFNHCRDGILTGAITATMSSLGKLDGILNQMTGCLIRQKIAAKASSHQAIIDNIYNATRTEFVKTDRLDGLYGIIDESTWVLVRGSNTEDVIRVSVESLDELHTKEIVGRIVNAVEDAK